MGLIEYLFDMGLGLQSYLEKNKKRKHLMIKQIPKSKEDLRKANQI